MKLGICEVCYIKPVAVVASTLDTAAKITFGTPLSLFMWKLYKIGFTVAMCVTVLRTIQLIICLVKGNGNLAKCVDDLKRSVIGTILLAIVPRADEIIDFLLNIIVRMV